MARFCLVLWVGTRLWVVLPAWWLLLYASRALCGMNATTPPKARPEDPSRGRFECLDHPERLSASLRATAGCTAVVHRLHHVTDVTVRGKTESPVPLPSRCRIEMYTPKSFLEHEVAAELGLPLTLVWILAFIRTCQVDAQNGLGRHGVPQHARPPRRLPPS
jgi:hypothetical protein